MQITTVAFTSILLNTPRVFTRTPQLLCNFGLYVTVLVRFACRSPLENQNQNIIGDYEDSWNRLNLFNKNKHPPYETATATLVSPNVKDSRIEDKWKSDFYGLRITHEITRSSRSTSQYPFRRKQPPPNGIYFNISTFITYRNAFTKRCCVKYGQSAVKRCFYKSF